MRAATSAWLLLFGWLAMRWLPFRRLLLGHKIKKLKHCFVVMQPKRVRITRLR